MVTPLYSFSSPIVIPTYTHVAIEGLVHITTSMTQLTCLLCLNYISSYSLCMHAHTIYVYTDFGFVNFEIFVVNWLSMKFSPPKFYWQNFHLYQLEQWCLTLARDDGNLLLYQIQVSQLSQNWMVPDPPPNSTFNPFCMAPEVDSGGNFDTSNQR